MKRAWLASAVASVLFAAGMTVVGGLAEESIGTDGVEWKESAAGIPLPGPGTRAVYSATPLGDDEDFGVTGLTLNWREPQAQWDDAYTQRVVWPVDMQLVGGDEHKVWAVYDAETGDPLYDGQETTRAFPSGPYVWYEDVEVGFPAENLLAFDIFHELRGPCGLLAGPSLEPGADEVQLHGHCSRLDGKGITTMHRTGDLQYENPADPRFQVAYDQGVPVPTTLTIPFSDMLLRMPHTEVVWRLDLQSWEMDTSYVPTLSAIESVDPPRLLPRTDWGLDDSALVDHPFRLSEAYQAALDETQVRGETVRGFLADHSDAYLRSAWSNRERDGSGNFHYHWYLTWTDGDDWIARHITLHPGGAGGVTSESLPSQVEVQAYTPSDTYSLPDPSFVPDRLPDPAEVIDRHGAYTGFEGVQNRYGFQVVEWGDGAMVAGGAYTYDSDPATGDAQATARWGTDGYDASYDQLMLYADGTPMYMERADYHRDPIVPPQEQSQPTDSSEPGGWTPPTAQATAGLGLLAVSGGLLTYLAPGLKAPVLTLFSRIRGEHLLEHPSRAAIVALIEADPGVHFQELLRRMDLGSSTLQHHLHKLTEAKIVRTNSDYGYNCYFPRKTDRAFIVAGPFLRAKGPRAILENVVHGEDGTVVAISKRTGLSKSTVSHHLRRMRDAGLVTGGGREGFHPTDIASRVV